MLPIKQKAFAYITYHNQLLVFEHPHAPEAGIQVPAGTIQPGESPEAAVMREAYEETGLTTLKLHRFLGEVKRDMSDFGIAQIHQRYFFHLLCEAEPPATWDHWETDPSDTPSAHLFRFYWVALPFENLIADHGRLLSLL